MQNPVLAMVQIKEKDDKHLKMKGQVSLKILITRNTQNSTIHLLKLRRYNMNKRNNFARR